MTVFLHITALFLFLYTAFGFKISDFGYNYITRLNSYFRSELQMTSIEEIFNVQEYTEPDEKLKGDTGHYGMVASAVEEATEAGNEMLEKGGNAFDAIIAVQFALSVVEGMNTGIGSGGFILCHDYEKGDTKMVNTHPKAPAAMTPDTFVDDNGDEIPFDERSTHGSAVGIPSIMKGLKYVHENYGTLPLETLIDPAIRLAEKEFTVHSLMERTLELFEHRIGEEARKKFMPDGVKLKEGDTMWQPELAHALKTIRDNGFDDVYEGEIADAIIQAVKEQGGIMTHQDLINYEVTVDEPLWTSYRGYDIALPTPPSAGGIGVAMQLKILEQLDISQHDPHSTEKYHLISQTLQLALADDDVHIEDTNFTPAPLDGVLDEDYIKEHMEQLSLDRKAEEKTAGDPWKYQKEGHSDREQGMSSSHEGLETTHFTAVDQWGNVAACTTSIERIYGSGIMVPGYGFLLNNHLTDFSTDPDGVNGPNGNKYPKSSKSPTILFHEGKPFFTLGTPGSATIIASVVQTIVNIIDYNMPLDDAINEPRVYVLPDLSKQWEDGLDDSVLEELSDLGYQFDQSFREESADTRIGDVQAIMIDHANERRLYGRADFPRPGDAESVE